MKALYRNHIQFTLHLVPNEVTQLHILSGMALWNATNSSTQYEMRYNKTKDWSNEDDKPLKVYYIDTSLKHSVQVNIQG